LKGIPSRTMPGIYELIGGQVNVSRLREWILQTCFAASRVGCTKK